jgi:flagellar hook-associated protein 2
MGRDREIAAGSDARFLVDGILLSRTSNTISDAIDGVTLKLQQAEVGTQATLTVARDVTAAVDSVKAFAKAYNDVIAFVAKNTAPGGLLEGNGSLRNSGRSMTQAMLTDILGPSFSRPTLVGVSLDKSGVLTVDSTALTAALKKDEAGVRNLFGLSGSTTGASLEYIGAGDSTTAGTYAVNITAPATSPSVTSAGATLPFDDAGVPKSLSITDGATGKSGSITLATGDDATALAVKLNALFTSKSMFLNASVVGGALTITGSQYGTGATFTVAYGAGDTTSATQLGIVAQKYSGTDIAGTIDGITATGNGQTLTANSGSTASGLLVRYSGTATGAIGNVTVTVGTGALISRLARTITRSGDGLIDSMTTSLDASSAKLQTRSDDVTARLARKKETLLAQFSAMETAIAKIQSQGTQITNMLKSLQTANN